MGKTIRKLPYRYLRNFRGRRAALRRGDRSVPPNPWDDYEFSDESMLPWRVCYRLAAEGRTLDEIRAVLTGKWGIKGRRAAQIAKRCMRGYQ